MKINGSCREGLNDKCDNMITLGEDELESLLKKLRKKMKDGKGYREICPRCEKITEVGHSNCSCNWK